MKNLTYILTTVILFCGLIYLSCGGSDRPSDAQRNGDETIDQPIRNTRPQPMNDTVYTHDNMLTSSGCQPPNLQLDKALNIKFCQNQNEDCLIDFAGYRWWTNYHFVGANNGYWWDNNQKQSYAPNNAWIGSDNNMHIAVKRVNLGGGEEWMSGEVVAVFKQGTKQLVNFGYGTYLVAARLVSGSSDFASLDRNVAFGVFTYQYGSSPIPNPYRELDLAEISKWGTPPCKNAANSRLCVGNAQFAIQDWNADTANVQRYYIDGGVKELTLVMVWKGANQPVTFKQYNGLYNLNNLPSRPNNSYTTKDSQNKFIPDDGCQLFHMNMWMGNYGGDEQVNGKHPGPSNGQTQEVAITNFQYTQKTNY
jgi:hypothetical protein